MMSKLIEEKINLKKREIRDVQNKLAGEEASYTILKKIRLSQINHKQEKTVKKPESVVSEIETPKRVSSPRATVSSPKPKQK